MKNDLQKQITEALKKGDQVRLSTLRLLYNALHNEEINTQAELTPDQEIAIVKRQLKQREEAIEAYEKAGRVESAEKEKQEAAILKEFLPEQMGESELGDIVDRVISESESKEFGLVMKQVMEQVKGMADGKMVSEIVRAKLQG